MAKKKSQARQKKRAQSRRARQSSGRAVDHAREAAESQRAIKTLGIGALAIAALLMFFAFKWDGKSAYDRLTGGDAEAQESVAR